MRVEPLGMGMVLKDDMRKPVSLCCLPLKDTRRQPSATRKHTPDLSGP